MWYVVILGAALGVLFGFGHMPIKHDGSLLPNLLVFFSILAGFLLTAIGLIGNGLAVLASSNWKVLQLFKATYSARLNRLCCLLVLFFISCVLILLVLYLGKSTPDFLYHVLAGITVASLWYSLFLPVAIVSLYKEYYSATIKEREKQEIAHGDKEQVLLEEFRAEMKKVRNTIVQKNGHER